MHHIIDLERLESYRENNRIEAKKALGGLPRSLWETYSAFANTFGGILLLGVEEKKDKSFLIHNLPDPERYVREFWSIVADKRYVSDNILQKEHVQIVELDQKRIIAIYVPKASKDRRPIYIGEDMYGGTYRRDGEGDYHCSRAEIDAMREEARQENEDETVLSGFDISALCMESVGRFRRRMQKKRPGHVWQELEDLPFLERIRALCLSDDGVYRPTAAGLLMFGKEKEIVKRYPCYALFYQEMGKHGIEKTVIASDTGDWSGNLFDFYLLVYRRLKSDIRVPEAYKKDCPSDETPIHRGMKELLVNCLVHADYREKQGVLVLKSGSRVTFENPGCFGVDPEAAKRGCPANAIHPVLTQMFHLIRVGNGDGRGISKIYEHWRDCGFALPKISEQIEPKRTQISISVSKRKSVPPRIKSAPAVSKNAMSKLTKSQKEAARQTIYELRRQQVIDYVTVAQKARTAEIEELLDMEHARAKHLLARMVSEGILETTGGMGNLCYRLKR